MNCWSLLFPELKKKITDHDVCVSKMKIVEEAVKEELTKLCVNLYKTFPSLPCDLVASRKTREDWFTPERRWLPAAISRWQKWSKVAVRTFNCSKRSPSMWNNDEKLQRLSCEQHFYAAISQKRTTTLFLSLDWVMIVSSFSISQSHVNSVFFFRGHWGKQLAEKTALNPILPR